MDSEVLRMPEAPRLVMEPNGPNPFFWIVAAAPKHRAARELAMLLHRRGVRQAELQRLEDAPVVK